MCLACFDTIYIVFGGFNYSMKAFEQVNTRNNKLQINIVLAPGNERFLGSRLEKYTQQNKMNNNVCTRWSN